MGAALAALGAKALGGAATGAATGGLSSAAQIGLSAGQMIAGAINRKKADAMLPPSENPMERQLLNTVRRRRRALETGTAASSAQKGLQAVVKNLGQNAFRAGGPVNTGVLAQLLNQGMQNITNQYGQQYGQTLGMEQEQVSKMADVSRDLALLKSARKSAQAERQMQAGQQNLLASIGGGNFYSQQG